MPTISVPQDRVAELFGRAMSQEEFAELCFSFGLELDAVVEEEGRTILRVDVPANRYDLLSAEGLGMSLYRFTHPEEPQRHPRIVTPENGPHILNVDASVNKVRPYVVAAVIRNAHINVPSFIDCQDKLNINLGRRRQLVSIGTHELKKVTFPVAYVAENPDEIHFLPLKAVKEYPDDVVPSGRQVVEDLSHHQQLREYVGLLEGQEVYPLIRNGGEHQVLSMPPLVNSDYSKHTYTFGGHHGEEENQLMDVFIEITATDLTRAHMTLDILLYSFASKEGSWVEPVEVVYQEPTEFALKNTTKKSDGTCVDTCPKLKWNVFELSMNSLNSLLGVKLEQEAIRGGLEKMGMLVSEGKKDVYIGKDFSISNNLLVRDIDPKNAKPCSVVACESHEGEILTVFVPPYRSDVLHEVDLIEDIGIGYGYDKINEYQASLSEHRVDKITSDVTCLLPRTDLTEYLRHILVAAGYTEILAFSLNNKVHEYMVQGQETKTSSDSLFNDDISCFFNPEVSNVPLLNPKSTHFTHLRASLLTGLLKAVKHNTQRPKPLQFFEIGDVVCIAPEKTGIADTNANPRIQQRIHCAVVRCAQADGFEYVKGILDLIECKLVPKGCQLKLVEHNIPVFAERRSALVVLESEGGKKQVCGVIGVVSPQVLTNTKIMFPVSYAEIDIELFL